MTRPTRPVTVLAAAVLLGPLLLLASPAAAVPIELGMDLGLGLRGLGRDDLDSAFQTSQLYQNVRGGLYLSEKGMLELAAGWFLYNFNDSGSDYREFTARLGYQHNSSVNRLNTFFYRLAVNYHDVQDGRFRGSQGGGSGALGFRAPLGGDFALRLETVLGGYAATSALDTEWFFGVNVGFSYFAGH